LLAYKGLFLLDQHWEHKEEMMKPYLGLEFPL